MCSLDSTFALDNYVRSGSTAPPHGPLGSGVVRLPPILAPYPALPFTCLRKSSILAGHEFPQQCCLRFRDSKHLERGSTTATTHYENFSPLESSRRAQRHHLLLGSGIHLYNVWRDVCDVSQNQANGQQDSPTCACDFAHRSADHPRDRIALDRLDCLQI
jgi:hypothetical protein